MTFSIASRAIGHNRPAFLVLEVGINHNGDLEKALEMVRVAKQLGADAVKFQTFTAAEFISNKDLTFTYRSQGTEVTESMLDMFSRYEFDPGEWRRIKEECDTHKIVFLSTPQNVSDMRLLVELGVPALKVGSDDFTNLPLLETYADTKLPLIISCGMADLGEVYDALKATRAQETGKVALLLCTSEYPTPPQNVNLRKLTTLAGAFPNVTLGFSDHTEGALAAVGAFALGARVFEKHFTLDRNLPGPDHWFSADPPDAQAWIGAIRNIERMMGSATVEPTGPEVDMRRLARRSLTVVRDTSAGDEFTPDNLGLRRPGTGLSPRWFGLILGRRASRSIGAGEQLTLGDVT